MGCRITLLQVAGLLVFLPCLALAGFVDMDTPLDKRTTTSLIDGTTYHLVCFYIYYVSLGFLFFSCI